jgi:hypothetical protein
VTREEWLEAAVAELESRLPPLPELKLSVGWPKGTRKHLAQCWSAKRSKDQRTNHIFVSPVLDDPVQVLQSLLHELVHAAVGTEAGHRKPFSQLAGKLGFLKPWTATPMGEALRQELTELAEKLGEYAHVQLTEREKQKARMKLWECSCGVKIRRAGELNAQCLDCDTKFEAQEA